MRSFIAFFFCFLLSGIALAQFTDTFSDGDFTNNPSWSGDAASFKINTSFQLQLNSSGEGIAALSVPFVMQQDMEWSCWAKLAFAPSDNNLSRVYIMSNTQDLKGDLNGYYLKLGETGSNDAIELVKQSGSTHTVICRGAEGALAAAFAIRIKVTRSSTGLWQVFADNTGGINYQLQASGSDNTFATGTYSGVYCKFTSSNNTKFYYDDFYAGPQILDNTPPQAQSVELVGQNGLIVKFNEPINASSAAQLLNYLVVPGNIAASTATINSSNSAWVDLHFTNNFSPDVNYSIQISGVKDLAGNTMQAASLPFAWHEAKAFDVLINEIMADPTPLVNLPDAEYVELYNRSDFAVELKNWSITVGSTSKPIPVVTIPSHGYLILCDDASKPLLESFGQVVDFTSFALTNAGTSLTLKDGMGQIMHYVIYTDKWYNSDYKKDGGWSLELIDPLNPCGEAANWTASNDKTGGTPGKLNSMNASNPDLKNPEISRIGVTDATHITIWFSESCDSTMLAKNDIYTIDNGIGNPISVTAQSPDFKVVYLTLSNPITAGVLYALSCSGLIKDCAGNSFNTLLTGKFAIPSESAENDIIINEVLFDPTTEGADFIEIVNISDKVIDLKDLILANYDTITNAITSFNSISDFSFLILPNEYYVLTTDSAAVKKSYFTSNPAAFINMSPFPEMNNSNGNVAIALKDGTLIDKMHYSAEMQFPLLNSIDGVSLERINPLRSSMDITNWHSASEAVGFATPGYKNSQFGLSTDSKAEISLSPEIFSPDNDGYNDVLSISYKFLEPGNMMKIQVFDANGRKVRDLLSNELCGTSGSFSWDGITNDSQKASIGRYVVFVEVFNLNGNLKLYKKSAILGGKL